MSQWKLVYTVEPGGRNDTETEYYGSEQGARRAFDNHQKIMKIKSAFLHPPGGIGVRKLK